MSANSSLDLSQFYSKMSATNLPAKGVHCIVPIDEFGWKEWLALTFSSLSIVHRKVLMVSFYAFWYARNKVVHEGTAPSMFNTLSFVVVFLRKNDMHSPQDCLRPSRSSGKWKALIVDVVKLNFDVAYDSHSMKSISGVICRDSEGFILAASSNPHLYVADLFQAEALACLVAVNFAWDLDFTRVRVEGYSLTVIKK
ncbi:hypothetical protein V6N11_080493 [Hibiscus sabdariffa]|uniref:RNase H type-1 domain-containing protein n=1 Tax=Hibiscus sabdariffa TaxID=183260 RepID=A0ABR2R7T0_9ROSI